MSTPTNFVLYFIMLLQLKVHSFFGFKLKNFKPILVIESFLTLLGC